MLRFGGDGVERGNIPAGPSKLTFPGTEHYAHVAAPDGAACGSESDVTFGSSQHPCRRARFCVGPAHCRGCLALTRCPLRQPAGSIDRWAALSYKGLANAM